MFLCMLRCPLFVLLAAAAAAQPTNPFLLEPEKTPAELFDYAPDYVVNVPAFDAANRPYIRSRTHDLDPTGYIHTLHDGDWVKRDFRSALRAAVSGFKETVKGGGWHGQRLVFDTDGVLYTVVRVRTESGQEKNLLVVSRDKGENFTASPLPAGDIVYEHDVGHNVVAGPPFLGILRFREKHPARWGNTHTLLVTKPRWDGDELVVPDPVVATRSCFGMSRHSGGASFAVTRGGKTHLVWGEMVDPESGRPGAPAYAATYDHATHSVGEPVFLAHAPPLNDVHNTPGICIDSGGYLHAITGSHGRSFYYTRSKEPGDTQCGWMEPDPVLTEGWTDGDGERGRQTYLSLLCTPDDTLHIAFRQWRKGVDPWHENSYYAALSYQRKPEDGQWSEAMPLAVAAYSGYSIYYHKLAADNAGNLYLSFSYLPKREIDTPTRPGKYHDRMVITSHDGGNTWRPARTKDFQAAGSRAD